jgi:hypothetical protein
MPLNPVAILILRRQPSMSSVRVDSAVSTTTTLTSHCSATSSSSARPGAVAGWTTRPSSATARAVRFHIGPGVEDAGDGTHVPMGDIIQKWMPLRGIDPLPKADMTVDRSASALAARLAKR